jgi:hypothetical protein
VDKDKNQRNISRGEDYGGPGDYPDSNQNSELEGETFSGGTAGTRQGSSEGESFGEFDDSGTGIDLTEEMDETGAGSGLGLIKGGEHGKSDVAGPGQYGGKAGGLKKNEK